MPSTLDSADFSAWITHLQQMLQQQLTQVSQQLPVFSGLQIQCAVEGEALLIAATTPVDLEPHSLFWVLEQFVRDCGPKLRRCDRSTLSVKLLLQGQIPDPVCHSFRLVLDDTTPIQLETPTATLAAAPVSAPPAPMMATTSPPSVGKSWGQMSAWGLALVAAYCGGGASYYAFLQSQRRATGPVAVVKAVPVAVMALGRIEPKGALTKLSVANAQDSRVNQLFVAEGDRVQAGQVIALLQGREKRQAARQQAQQSVQIARAKLAKAQAGEVKVASVAAQRAQIARLIAQLTTARAEKQAAIAQVQAKLRYATINYQRDQMLYTAGAISRSALDQKQTEVETAQAQLAIVTAQLENVTATLQQQIQQERAVLASLLEVRPVDVQVTQAELDYALTQVAQAETEMADLYVRSLTAGQILKINTQVGEQINPSQGIVEIGQTDQMYAITEVYETDVRKIKVGQPATIVSENGGFIGKVQGKVEQIGWQIKKKNILDADPAAAKDARVVEVKVRIQPKDTAKVARLTNLQVRVRIHL